MATRAGRATLTRPPARPAPDPRARPPISRTRRLDGDQVLDNVLIARCQNHEQQHEMLAAVAAKMTDEDIVGAAVYLASKAP